MVGYFLRERIQGIIIGDNTSMNYIKLLLSPRSRSIHQSKLNTILAQTKAQGSGVLHPLYSKIFIAQLSKAIDQQKCISLLLCKLEESQSVLTIVKLFTIILSLCIEGNYQGLIITCIQNASFTADRAFKLENKEYQSWFIPFYQKFIRYLSKIPSNAEILIEAISQNPKIQAKNYINNLFRLINQMSIILQSTNNAINTIGRYYRRQLIAFEELYRTMKIQFTNIYKYFGITILGIVKNYRSLDIQQLQAFVQAIPEYQLVIDKLQEFLMNKYFRGSCKYSQPYILAQDIAQILYFIQKSKQGLK